MTAAKWSWRVALALLTLYGLWRLSVSGADLEVKMSDSITLKLYISPPPKEGK